RALARSSSSRYTSAKSFDQASVSPDSTEARISVIGADGSMDTVKASPEGRHQPGERLPRECTLSVPRGSTPGDERTAGEAASERKNSPRTTRRRDVGAKDVGAHRRPRSRFCFRLDLRPPFPSPSSFPSPSPSPSPFPSPFPSPILLPSPSLFLPLPSP